MIGKPAQSRLRTVATMVAVIATMTFASAGSCGGGTSTPSLADRIRQTQIWGHSEIKIGVSTSEPLMGFLDHGEYSGFDIDIARFIAAQLGFGAGQITWVPVNIGDRERVLLDGSVDLVVASYSITDERKKKVRFAGPYFVTQQEVLILTSNPFKIRNLEDLTKTGYKTCTTGGSTSEEELRKRGITSVAKDRQLDCLPGLISRDYVALSTDNTILAGIKSLHPDQLTIVNMPFGTTEQLGIGVRPDDQALQDSVSCILKKSYDQGQARQSTAWLTAYNNNLRLILGADGAHQPPVLDVPNLVGCSA